MVRGRRKRNERTVAVKPARLGAVLTDLQSGRQGFSATLGTDDLWLDVSLQHPQQRMGLVYVIQALLAVRYRRLKHAPMVTHCAPSA